MEIPKLLEEALKREAFEKGIDEEVLIIDKLSRDLDPATRFALYVEKADDLLSEARKYLEAGDLVQASGKAWGGLRLRGQGLRGEEGARALQAQAAGGGDE
ncbi:MAG: PaREP1 family protein [Thermoprotei archaeon]